jgi:SAM-dependent methyltransferase
VNKRSIARIVPGLRSSAAALDRYEAELVNAGQVIGRMDAVCEARASEVASLRFEVDDLRLDNDRLRRYLNELAFSPQAFDGTENGWPIPSAALRFLVAGTDDVEVFLRLGRAGAELVQEMPARTGRAFADLGRVLDFGSGCGRVVRHLSDAGPEVYGCDANPHAVAWCNVHLPFGRFSVNSLTPPLPYPDGYFGQVFAFSVFTHLSVELQVAWIAELRRILSPGGFLLLTTHGDACIDPLSPDERAMYAAGEPVVRLSERSGANECAAFHPPSYVETVLANGWLVAEHAPAGAKGNLPQDAYLLRRPE